MQRLVVVPLFLVFAYAVHWVQQGLPYHNAWDMDFITTMDLFQMADGLLPQHINHPGLGLYLIQRWLWPFADLSSRNVTQLITSPLPLLSAAEATLWVRSLTVIPATLLLMGNSFGLIDPTRPKNWRWALGATVVVATWAGIWAVQAKLVRSELYAIAWYSLAFAGVPLLRTRWRSQVLACICFFAGLGFLTKFQGLFLHAALVLLCTHALLPDQLPRLPRGRGFLVGALVGFVGLSVLAMFAYIPNYFAQFSPKKGPNVFFWLVMLVLLAPLALPWLSRLARATLKLRRPSLVNLVRPSEEVLRFVAMPYWAVLGVFAVFLVHFCLGLSFATSLEYLFFDWRMIFLKIGGHNTPQSSLFPQFWWNLKFHSLPLLVWLGTVWHFHAEFNKRERTFLLLHAGLVFLSLVLASRGRLQDSLWNDVLIAWGFSYLLPRLARVPQSLVFTALALLVGWNLIHLHVPSADGVDYRPMPAERFWQEPYESPVNPYSERMAALKENPFIYAQTQHLANHSSLLRQTLRQLWKSPHPTLRHIELPKREDISHFVVIRPPQQESTIHPAAFVVWLGAVDLEHVTDCPFTQNIVKSGDERWREIRPGTKKCRLMSSRVRVALDFTKIIGPTPVR